MINFLWMPDLSFKVPDLLKDVPDPKTEVPDLGSGGISG